MANGILFLPAVGCISHHFFKRRALATGAPASLFSRQLEADDGPLSAGIVVSGSSIGGIVFPISPSVSLLRRDVGSSRTTTSLAVLNNLFKKSGFGWGVRASGFLAMGCLIVANLTMTTRLPPRKKRPAHLQGALRPVIVAAC